MMKVGLRALVAVAALMAALPVGTSAQERPKDWQPPPIERIPNHRADWRQVVIEVASYAKSRNPNFFVLVRGAPELMVKGEREAQWEQARDPAGLNFEKRLPLGTVMRSYLKPLDGMVFDGLYCGSFAFDQPLAKALSERRALDTKIAQERREGIERLPVAAPQGPFSNDPEEETRKAAEATRQAIKAERQRRTLYAYAAMREAGRTILSIENCANASQSAKAHGSAERDKVLTFAATGDAGLDLLPKGHPNHENASPVITPSQARNWLMLPNGRRFGSRAEWVMKVADTNFDMVVVDVVHRGTDSLTKDDVAKLKFKKLGSPRLVLADMPVGRAFDWRWYWQKEWQAGDPSFLFAPVPEEPGAFVTDMADPKWKDILGKYIAGVMDLGFDGVILDDLDTYLWFEDLMPLKD